MVCTIHKLAKTVLSLEETVSEQDLHCKGDEFSQSSF